MSAKVRKENRKINEIKQNCSLFSRLFIATQTAGRDKDMIEFFSPDNQNYPAAISEHGHLYTGTKSDLLTCFEELAAALTSSTNSDATSVDGMVMANMLVLDNTQQDTFGD